MFRRPWAATLVLLGSSVATARVTSAQRWDRIVPRWDRIEIGSHAQYTWFSSALRLEPTEGYGAHGGLFVFRDLALEVDYSFAPTRGNTRGDIDFRPFSTSAVYHLPLSPNTHLLLGAGYVMDNYAGDTTKNEWEDGV